jgi:hypothetical protein
MREITLNIKNARIVRDMEDVKFYADMLLPYFKYIGGHWTPYQRPENRERDYASFYGRFKSNDVVSIINIEGPDVEDETFYDYAWSDYDAINLPAIQINYNGDVAGYLVKERNVLWASDWTHNRANVEAVKKILSTLDEAGLIHKHEVGIATDMDNDGIITLGGDPEFELLANAQEYNVLYAEDYYSGYDDEVGVDGSGNQVEIRPHYGETPEEYVENFKAIIRGIEDPLSVIGNVYPLGGHMHFGGIPMRTQYTTLLDDWLGRPLMTLNGEKREAWGYGELGDCRMQEWGFEYRVLPATIYADPEMVRIVYKIAQSILKELASKGEIKYHLRSDDLVAKKDYLRFITRDEYNYFMNARENLWKKALNDIYINKNWGGKIKEGIYVKYSGDSFPASVRDYINTELGSIKTPEGKYYNIRLFGLAKSRGYVYSGEELLPQSGVPAHHMSWGLSWQCRHGDFKELKRVIGIIKSYIEREIRDDS